MSLSNNNKQIFIFLGAPGSGKGTLSYLCVEKLGWKQLSTGDLCRKHIAERTLLGAEIDLAIKSGTLVADSVIIDMVDQWLEQEKKLDVSIILDGFPRTVSQAEGFVRLIQDKFPFMPLRIVRFIISDETVIKRLGSRLICSNKNCQRVYSMDTHGDFSPKIAMHCDDCNFKLIVRDDDKPEAIKTRLAAYKYHVGALVDFYEKSGFEIADIDAEGTSESIFNNFLDMIEQ